MCIMDELRKGFSLFYDMICRDGKKDILLMPYAEYTLQLFILYNNALYKGILHEGGALAQAFCAIGVDQPRDQLVVFLDSFYLFRHTQSAHNE